MTNQASQAAPAGANPRERLSALLPGVRAFAIPMTTRFRGITVREGALIEGPAGWGEFSPFAEYGPRECAAGWPARWRPPAPAGRSRSGTGSG